MEGTPSHTGNDLNMPNYSYKIASSAPRGPQTLEERNVFAIYVSYYIKVKLTLSGMGGEVALKLPFILGHVDNSMLLVSGGVVGGNDITSCDGAIGSGSGKTTASVGGSATGITAEIQAQCSRKIVKEKYCDNNGNDGDNNDSKQTAGADAANISAIAIICGSGNGSVITTQSTLDDVNSSSGASKKENGRKSVVEIDVIVVDDSSIATIPTVLENTRKINVGVAVPPALEGNVNVITAQVHTSAI